MTKKQLRPIPVLVLAVLLTLPADAQQSDAEKLIEAGHWKKARAIVEARIRQAPDDPLSNFLLSQIRNAFGDFSSPLPLAEKAVALNGHIAKFHRQLAETVGLEAQHASPFRLIFLARRFRSEIDTAISLDPRDLQTRRDLMEYYLVAPGIAGGDIQKATGVAAAIAELDATEGLLAKARIATVQKHTSETEALLRQAAQARPASYRALVELAKFYLAGEHYNSAAAENAARELLQVDPTRVEPYAFLAQVSAEKADWNALDASLAEAAQKCPDDLAPYYRAAETLLSSGRDPARAERYLRTYQDREPEGNEPTLAETRRKLATAAHAQGHRPDTLTVSKNPG